MKRYYYSDRLTTEGETLGPVNVEELKELYFEKKITEDCLVCLEGTEDQLKIDELISRYNKSGDNKKLEALWNTTKLIFIPTVAVFSNGRNFMNIKVQILHPVFVYIGEH